MTPSLENKRGTVRHECPHFLMFKTDLVLDSFLLPAMVSFFCRWIRIKPCGVSDIGTSWFLAEQLPPLISMFQVMRPFVELLTFFYDVCRYSGGVAPIFMEMISLHVTLGVIYLLS